MATVVGALAARRLDVVIGNADWDDFVEWLKDVVAEAGRFALVVPSAGLWADFPVSLARDGLGQIGVPTLHQGTPRPGELAGVAHWVVDEVRPDIAEVDLNRPRRVGPGARPGHCPIRSLGGGGNNAGGPASSPRANDSVEGQRPPA